MTKRDAIDRFFSAPHRLYSVVAAKPERGIKIGPIEAIDGTPIGDYANTSGLSKDPKTPPMIAFWSRFDNVSQCISCSLDRGRSRKRYEGMFLKAKGGKVTIRSLSLTPLKTIWNAL
ncbi:MAG: hypothetical protein ACO1SV_24085 [Fimbriimonas sp.]